MIDTLTQLGVGGAVAVLVLKEVRAILQDRKNGHGDVKANEKTADFWMLQFNAIAAKIDSITPILKSQTEILQRMEENQSKVSEALVQLTTLQNVIARRELQ